MTQQNGRLSAAKKKELIKRAQEAVQSTPKRSTSSTPMRSTPSSRQGTNHPNNASPFSNSGKKLSAAEKQALIERAQEAVHSTPKRSTSSTPMRSTPSSRQGTNHANNASPFSNSGKKLSKAEKKALIERASQAVHAPNAESVIQSPPRRTTSRAATSRTSRRQSEPQTNTSQSRRSDSGTTRAKQLQEGRALAAVWAKELKERERNQQQTPARKSSSPVKEEYSPPFAIGTPHPKSKWPDPRVEEQRGGYFAYPEQVRSSLLSTASGRVRQQDHHIFETSEEEQPSIYSNGEYDDSFIDEEANDSSHTWSTFKTWAVVILGVWIASCHFFPLSGTGVSVVVPERMANHVLNVRPPQCFETTVQDNDMVTVPPEYLKKRGVERCHPPAVPCPPSGHCFGGFLMECQGPYLHPSSAGKSCILTKEATEALHGVEEVLGNLTVAHVCNFLRDCGDDSVKARNG